MQKENLTDKKLSIKNEIMTWINEFQKKEGRKVAKEDKDPIKHLYAQNHELTK